MSNKLVIIYLLMGILEEIKHLRYKSKTALNSPTLLLSDPSLLLESREYLCTFKAFQATNVVGGSMVVCWRFLDFVEGFLFLVEDFFFLVEGLFGKGMLKYCLGSLKSYFLKWLVLRIK